MYFHKIYMITVRKRSSGKVIFSQASVCSRGESASQQCQGAGIPPLEGSPPPSHPKADPLRRGATSGCRSLRRQTPIKKCQPTGGTHPTGMHTCVNIYIYLGLYVMWSIAAIFTFHFKSTFYVGSVVVRRKDNKGGSYS